MHATTGERPCDLLLLEGLADPRPRVREPEQNKARIIALPEHHFDISSAPEIEVRPLSVYEEAAL